MPTLFDPIQIGDISCKNRVFMAPLTRARATKEGVPTPLMAEYYAQRADAGLIISEAIGISRQATGWIYAPGLWTDEQVEAWKPVTEAVHAKGGKIVAQIWHMGRMAHSSIIGEQPVAPSPSTAPGYIHTYEGKQSYEEARALSVEEIQVIVADFAKAARNALKAGFDGIQIHAANGYLIDEFLRDGTNQRTDQYGGSPENRIRFLREIVEAVSAAIGAEKVGVRLSPNGEIQGCFDTDPATVFVPAAKMLQEHNVAWLGLRESDPEGSFVFAPPTTQAKLAPEIRKVFTNPLVLNQGYSYEEAEKTVESGLANAISFGQAFISNPDLVQRFREGLPLTQGNPKTWYGAWLGAEGYTDYPKADGSKAD